MLQPGASVSLLGLSVPIHECECHSELEQRTPRLTDTALKDLLQDRGPQNYRSANVHPPDLKCEAQGWRETQPRPPDPGARREGHWESPSRAKDGAKEAQTPMWVADLMCRTFWFSNRSGPAPSGTWQCLATICDSYN